MGNSEVEYIESENLVDLPDVNASFDTLLAMLDSKDWVSVCEALNNVRQLWVIYSIFFTSIIRLHSRSAVCKTAILASVDIFTSDNDEVIDSVDPLLVQLILKSSQDKLSLLQTIAWNLLRLIHFNCKLLLAGNGRDQSLRY
ncbi:hypothetical protein ZIOFF_027405 [Zingiber officinale]|uniref:ARM repeat superfamily protein n=1 Tax=Zingiber officinale TaxID=94328 RepID=A0A8J5GT77_ZINOF|nr:hypothetical protein ZIOFF_027405 [Zingiber officinale]